ncbi:MAG TPA: helix-turn-helix transcriptional regulator [Leptolyngbya sp.]|jgi:transcriptional regulator with XRE-family HTH domain|nr:helix-turn-helix transcriptional regulator [Leptolyngbya sp.]
MGKIRLKVRELAKEKKWTLREVSDRTEIPYGTIRSYAHSPTLATVDYTALIRLARAFEVTIEDLVEVIEE